MQGRELAVRVRLEGTRKANIHLSALPKKKGQPVAREDSLKKRYNFSLTPIAREGLERLATQRELTTSEMLEQLGRGELSLGEPIREAKPTLADLIDEELKKTPGIGGLNRLVEATGISATRLLELGSGDKPSDIEISNLAQGLWKNETHNWDEDELLELVVAQFGDRVLPDEWNGVTEVESPAGDSDREKLGNGS